MNYKLSEIIAKLGGKLVGEDVSVKTIAATDKAQAGDLTYIADRKYLKDLANCKASAIIIKASDASMLDTLNLTISRIITDNPYLYFSKVITLFNPIPRLTIGVKSTAIIGENVTLGENPAISDNVVIGNNVQIGSNCQIYPNVVIGNDVIIGDDVIIYANATFYSNVKVGNSCIFHSGAVIGSDGFGNALDEKKTWHKVPQIGGVIIGDNVEIGANTTVDCGTLNPTVIEDGVRIDNLVQIAHNVRVKAHAAIAATVGIAGSTTIGKHCQIGGGTGITGHITITDHAVIGGASVVSKDITVPDLYSSAIPVFKFKDWSKIMVYMRNLPQTNEKIKNLEKQVQELLNIKGNHNDE